MKYLLHGCTGANKLHGKVLPQCFHTAITTRDDEIYHARVVPRVLKPWLMQYHTIISSWRISNQSVARFILRQPISVRKFDVNKLDLPVVKLVSRGLCSPFHLAYVGDPVFRVRSRIWRQIVWREYLAAKEQKCDSRADRGCPGDSPPTDKLNHYSNRFPYNRPCRNKRLCRLKYLEATGTIIWKRSCDHAGRSLRQKRSVVRDRLDFYPCDRDDRKWLWSDRNRCKRSLRQKRWDISHDAPDCL